jgi:hypothetical protein
MTPVIDLGQILSVNPLYINESGENVPSINVQSFLDGTVMPIPWLPIGAQQFQPKAGQGVIYVRMGNFSHRIVAFFGLNPEYIRKGQFGLNPGEVVVQSDSGLGYLKLSGDGRVELVTGDTTSRMEGSNSGWSFTSASVRMSTYSKTIFKINEDGSAAIERTLSNDAGVASIAMDKDGNISATTPVDITFKGKNIYLDGKVYLGPGASEPSRRSSSGLAVSSGQFGTYAFDFLTGAPIPGTGNVNILA